jgi:heat shock protein HslJ
MLVDAAPSIGTRLAGFGSSEVPMSTAHELSGRAVVLAIPLLLAFGCGRADRPPASDVSTNTAWTALEGVDWTLQAISNVAVTFDRPITLRIENGVAFGFAGCNRYRGPAKPGPSAGAIEIGPVLATKKACAGPSLEPQYLAALEEAKRWAINGTELTISYGEADSAGTLRYQTKASSPPA